VRLGETAAAAVLAALAELGADDAEVGAARAVVNAGSAFDGFELPVQAAGVDGPASGRTTLVLTQPGAARLVAATAGAGRVADIAQIGETMKTAAAAAAAAVAGLLGGGEPPAPVARLVAEEDPAETWEDGACVATVALTICGEPAALVLVVAPELAERLEQEGPATVASDGDSCAADGAIAGESLREVRVRLWAELGRTRMALGRAIGLAPGEVVELDASVDDPVVIFVNGVRLGSGHLVVGDDGEWAFRVAEVSAGATLRGELNGGDAAQAPPADADKSEA
jgi:flagellar motor switch protein FliN/FliY